MVNVCKMECRTEGCGERPSFGVTGTKTAQYCAQHALDGMVNVCSINCQTQGCGKRSSFGVAGTKMTENCVQHAMDGMVDVRSRKCRTEGCDKQSSFGVAGTKTMEYCAQRAPGGMVNVTKNGTFANAEEYMRRKVDSHHSEEEAVVSTKWKTVHPAANASAPSDGSGDSHKRPRHSDVESKAEGLTMAVTDMLKCSSVKSEVLLSL
ncbi:unnamed protein product [Ascophyllum nodosum]